MDYGKTKFPHLRISSFFDCKIIGRLNRFTVLAEINKKIEKVHINNTGKLEQWIRKRNVGYCYQINGNKLKYRLFAIKYRDSSVVIDTSLHMKYFEMLANYGFFERFGIEKIIRKNPRIGKHILDYEYEKGYIELKSSTLKNGQYSEYPDTYTKRGTEHVKLLNKLKRKNFLIIVSGIPDAKKFRFNRIYGKEINKIIKESKVNLIAFSIKFVVEEGLIVFNRFLETEI